jgi:tRNA/tmRNA/rRNA uracil-C5-methylase (TrmA/RlmC/RlmD family)
VSVLELYAGVGVLGVHAAAAVLGEAQPSDDWRVVCADSNPFISNTVFRHGLGSLPEAHRHKLRYLRATAEEAVSESLGLHEDCDVLVVNPPRRGLSEAVMKMLLSTDQHGKTANPSLMDGLTLPRLF